MSASESKNGQSFQITSGTEDEGMELLRNLLKNGIIKTFDGISMWPMRSKKDIQKHHIYFKHDQRELGVARFENIAATRILYNKYCNGSFQSSSFIGVEDSDNTTPPIIFPLQGCWAHNGEELEIHEKTLQWALDLLVHKKNVEEGFEPDDWSSENCAVSDDLVYFLGAIEIKNGSWILVLPVNGFNLEEPEQKRIIFIDLKRPRDLLAGRNMLTCFEDRTFLMIYEDQQYTFEFESSILRHFRVSVETTEVFYFVTAEGVEIRKWCLKSGAWIGSCRKVSVILQNSSPLCFLYGQILVLADSPSVYILINAQAEVERFSSPLSFPPGEYRVFTDATDRFLISLKRDTYLLCKHH